MSHFFVVVVVGSNSTAFGLDNHDENGVHTGHRLDKFVEQQQEGVET